MANLETIQALLVELKNENEKDHESIIRRLDITNGNVGKNTAFRNRTLGALTVVSFLGISSFIGVILMWIKILTL